MEPSTLSDLRDATRTRLDDRALSKPRWADAVIDRALNEAQNEAAVRARLLRDEVTDSITLLTVTAAAPLVLLHRSVFDVDHAYRVSDGAPLAAATEQGLYRGNRAWRTRTAAQPDQYLLQVRPDERLQLLFVPAPTADAQVRLVVYRYPRFPMEADDDTPEIAPVHHEGLIAWAAYRCWSIRDPDRYDPVKAEAARAEFEAQFGRRPSADELRQRREPRERTAIARDF